MTPAKREQLKLELNRSMRADPSEVVALRLLETDHEFAAPIDGVCACGRLLRDGDFAVCESCRRGEA